LYPDTPSATQPKVELVWVTNENVFEIFAGDWASEDLRDLPFENFEQ
jgi:hypothetical protein